MPTIESSSTNDTGSGTSHVITMASGITAGDFLVAGVLTDQNTTTQSFNTPAGWTKQEESLEQFAKQYAIYTKTAAGSDSITVTTGETCDCLAFCIRISDHNGYGASDKSVSPAFDTSETSPSVAVSASNSLALVGHFRSGSAGDTLTEPAGTTSLFDDTHASSGTRQTVVYTTVNPASTGTFVWSWTGSGGWNQAWTMVIEAVGGPTFSAGPTVDRLADTRAVIKATATI